MTYPCTKEGDPGDPVVFTDTFPRDTGRARFANSPNTCGDEDSQEAGTLTGRSSRDDDEGRLRWRLLAAIVRRCVRFFMIFSADLARITVDFTEVARGDVPLDCGRGIGLTVNEVADAVNRFFGNSHEMLVLNILEEKSIDPEELARLRQLLERSK